jgi:hypothetical protein
LVGFGLYLYYTEAVKGQSKQTARAAEATEDSLAEIKTQASHMGAQTKILRKSVEATEKSAAAALLNAQAVINAERAWLTVTIEEEFSPLPDVARNRIENERRQMERIMAEDGEQKIYYISIHNQGRTPAKIVGGGFL